MENNRNTCWDKLCDQCINRLVRGQIDIRQRYIVGRPMRAKANNAEATEQIDRGFLASRVASQYTARSKKTTLAASWRGLVGVNQHTASIHDSWNAVDNGHSDNLLLRMAMEHEK